VKILQALEVRQRVSSIKSGGHAMRIVLLAEHQVQQINSAKRTEGVKVSFVGKVSRNESSLSRRASK
jgi:hypothetical protein